MEFVYRCYRCLGLVYEYQILYGSHNCRKCGSRKVEPIMQDLTKFGKWYCKKVNRIGIWYNRKLKKDKGEI